MRSEGLSSDDLLARFGPALTWQCAAGLVAELPHVDLQYLRSVSAKLQSMPFQFLGEDVHANLAANQQLPPSQQELASVVM